jgi:flagellar basal-body rod modification protein FlgD
MTTIANTTSANQSTGTQSVVNPKSLLDKDDFLKLFVAQLQHQDPMSPMDNDQMVSQMSQLSTVEQLTNLASTNASMASSLVSSSAVGLIGRTVTWTDSDKATHTGVVTKVSTKDGAPSLTVGDTDGVDPSSITQVA